MSTEQPTPEPTSAARKQLDNLVALAQTDPHEPCSRALDQAQDRATAYHEQCLAAHRMLCDIERSRNDRALSRELSTVMDVLLGTSEERTERT